MAAARPVPADRLRGATLGPGTPGADTLGMDLIGKARQPRKPISRAQIETVISRSVAGVGLVFTLQVLPIMIEQLDVRKPIVAYVGPAILAAALVFVLVTTILKKGIKVATGAVALIYLVALLVWPFLMRDPTLVLDGVPWLWFLCTVATSCAAIAFPLFWAAAYTVLAPAIYGVVRSTPSGGAADPLLASLDAVYAILLGQVVLILIFMLRQAAAAVDAAQLNALDKYEHAVRQHATEIERVQVDSIVHDTVLATLLSAAGARSPKAAGLAAAMARNALSRLEEAGSASASDETVIPFSSLGRRIRDAAAAIASSFVVTEHDLTPMTVPVHASEAIYSATVQAMVNSLEHAGPAGAAVTRTLTMKPNLQGGCTIEIADNGVGFDPATVPSERLGLRVSIQERVTSAGGSVRVHTGVGEGTRIVIDWPRAAGEPDPLVGLFSTDELSGARPPCRRRPARIGGAGMITVPRGLILSLAAAFSAYHVVLGIYSLDVPAHPAPAVVAICLYAVATILSLWPTGPVRMPLWVAFFNVAVSAAVPLLVGSQLDGSIANGYATWYVAAVGTLMTITATRKQQAASLIGVGFLALHTVVWAGPAALASMGVIGSMVWVVVAILTSRALAKAGRDARQYALAEREATEWQAAQEAHLDERQVRLAHTIRLAAPMLRRIIELGGELSEAERQECRYLEAAVRDEIRGRKLLNDAVRQEVMEARRRGAIVTLLDEGTIDDLGGKELDAVLNRLADAIGSTKADKIIARTSANGSETAVTVVGLSSPDPSVSALGQDTPGEEVDLWLEIPRDQRASAH